MNKLERQLQTENKVDAENCLKIYDKLKEITGGVYDSDWSTLVKAHWEGNTPNRVLVYRPSKIGYIFLNGL